MIFPFSQLLVRYCNFNVVLLFLSLQGICIQRRRRQSQSPLSRDCKIRSIKRWTGNGSLTSPSNLLFPHLLYVCLFLFSYLSLSSLSPLSRLLILFILSSGSIRPAPHTHTHTVCSFSFYISFKFRASFTSLPLRQ